MWKDPHRFTPLSPRRKPGPIAPRHELLMIEVRVLQQLGKLRAAEAWIPAVAGKTCNRSKADDPRFWSATTTSAAIGRRRVAAAHGGVRPGAPPRAAAP